jgi:hypothetical protein
LYSNLFFEKKESALNLSKNKFIGKEKLKKSKLDGRRKFLYSKRNTGFGRT